MAIPFQVYRLDKLYSHLEGTTKAIRRYKYQKSNSDGLYHSTTSHNYPNHQNNNQIKCNNYAAFGTTFLHARLFLLSKIICIEFTAHALLFNGLAILPGLFVCPTLLFAGTTWRISDMQLPKGATIAVADGEIFNFFQNVSEDAHPQLSALPQADVDTETNNASTGGNSSSANPDQSQASEDNFAAGIADLLNQRVLKGKITGLVIIAAPKALGELRKHYHKELETVLIGEISKDLTGHSIQEIEKAIATA